MRKIASVFMILILALSLSGCLNFSSDLFTLPVMSRDQAQLKKMIDSITTKNWQITSPQSGDNRYTVQFVDLYGDGVAEAIAFFKNHKDLKLRVVIYSKSGSSSYSMMCGFTMNGDLIDTIDYVDLNGDGSRELIIKNRSESQSLYGVNVYAIRNDDATLLLERACTDMAFFDMDYDMLPEILCLNNSETGPDAYAELFKYDTDSENKQIDLLVSLGTAPITSGMRAPDKITTGLLYEDMPAIIVDGRKTLAEGMSIYCADIFTYTDGELRNLSENLAFYASSESRSNPVYCMDVDFDGYIEFPVSVKFMTSDKYLTEDIYYQQWFSYSKDGTTKKEVSTFYPSKWYLIFPESWYEVYLLKIDDEEEGSVLYKFAFEQNEKLNIALEIHVYNAEDKQTISPPDDLTFLVESNEFLFYIKLPEYSDKLPLPKKMYFSGPGQIKRQFVIFDVNGVAQRVSS